MALLLHKVLVLCTIRSSPNQLKLYEVISDTCSNGIHPCKKIKYGMVWMLTNPNELKKANEKWALKLLSCLFGW